jgi:hypothetical protein
MVLISVLEGVLEDIFKISICKIQGKSEEQQLRLLTSFSRGNKSGNQLYGGRAWVYTSAKTCGNFRLKHQEF